MTLLGPRSRPWPRATPWPRASLPQRAHRIAGHRLRTGWAPLLSRTTVGGRGKRPNKVQGQEEQSHHQIYKQTNQQQEEQPNQQADQDPSEEDALSESEEESEDYYIPGPPQQGDYVHSFQFEHRGRKTCTTLNMDASDGAFDLAVHDSGKAFQEEPDDPTKDGDMSLPDSNEDKEADSLFGK
ncbi:hypothetical protein ZWY2020_047922 [Hordeum vulgare]|nr:hypothetical protein ZWY2020_047922 [Hordeum vulgare]